MNPKVPPLSERLRRNHYTEGDYSVFTEKAHLARGFCCGSGCRHCPFLPRALAGNREVSAEIAAMHVPTT